MWVLALFTLSMIATLLSYKKRSLGRYKLDLLALISGSAAVMFLVDSIHSYLEEGTFIEFTYDSLILSMILTASAVMIWVIALLLMRSRR